MYGSPTEPSFEPVPIRNSRVETMLHYLRETHVEGGVLLAQFAVTGGDSGWHTHLMMSEVASLNLAPFLQSKAVSEWLPMLQLDDASTTNPKWEWMGPTRFQEWLKDVLQKGGSRGRYKWSHWELMKDVEQYWKGFSDPDGTGWTADVYGSTEAWSPWFRGRRSDRSWLILDKRRDRVWLLCLTDTR